jgi:hypothetical protein
MNRFYGFRGAASICLFGKHATLGITNSQESLIASQSRFSSEDSTFCTFGTNSQKAFDDFAEASHYSGKHAALGFTDSL